MVYEPAARRRLRRERSSSMISAAARMPIPGRTRLSTGSPATPSRAIASSPGGRGAGWGKRPVEALRRGGRAASGRTMAGSRRSWLRNPAVQRESVVGQFLLDLLDRLRAEAIDGQQILLAAGDQRPDRVHALAPEAVERAHGKIQLLDREARGVV